MHNVENERVKTRKHPLGKENAIGATVERLRKAKGIKQKDFVSQMQVAGVDINPTSYSKLEGQVRCATDIETYVIAKILGVKMEDLFSDWIFEQ